MKFKEYLKDKDFSITITPDMLFVFYNNFDDKEIDLSVGRNEILSSVNDNNNVEVIDNPTNEVKLEKKVKKRITNYVLHPEIPYENRINYKITDDNLGVGSNEEKFRNNIEAIRLLKKLDEEDRYANAEEQEVLSKYVGWGGLQQAFDEKAPENIEMKKFQNCY